MAGTNPKAAKGGRRSLSERQRKRLALRLYGAIRKRCESFEKFKAALREKRTTVREVTVRGWLPPLALLNQDPDHGSKVRTQDWLALKTPDLPGLVEVAAMLDVSVDHLLGFAVPERTSDREPPGELARSLLAHVIGHCLAAAPNRRRDGLAEAVGGRLTTGASRRTTAVSGSIESGALAIEVGDPALLHPMLLVVDNPQRFLAAVVDDVVQRAERWEHERKEPERQRVRDEIRRLVPHIEELSDEAGMPTSQVLRWLLDAALDPLLPKSHGSVTTLARDLATHHARTLSDAADDERLKAHLLEAITRATAVDTNHRADRRRQTGRQKRPG